MLIELHRVMCCPGKERLERIYELVSISRVGYSCCDFRVVGKKLNGDVLYILCHIVHINYKERWSKHCSLGNAGLNFGRDRFVAIDYYLLYSVCEEGCYPSEDFTSDLHSFQLVDQSLMVDLIKGF